MWTDRIALNAALAALVTPAAAEYAHTPFYDRPFEIADIALSVLEGEDVAVPEGDVPLAAAVAAFLLVSELGLGEAFEEAVGGDDEDDDDDDEGEGEEGDDYAEAYDLLQAVRPWILAVPQDSEVDAMLARLDALMPTKERPEKLDADPEAAEVVAQALVGHLERAANADLYLGRDLARAMDTVADLAMQGCAGEEDIRTRRFEIAAIYFEDALEAPLSVMASEEAEQIEASFEALQQGDLSACDTIGLAFENADRRLFP